MKYFLDAIFLTMSACLCWVVWDVTQGDILSQRVFPTVTVGGVLILVDLWLHNCMDD